ncbi:hypothetical protein EKH55_2407 [Sinorhizobium alkalisoli]|nr:hypothetical protein EKH55_2407 [Sinorhizobium alkalisoli]
MVRHVLFRLPGLYFKDCVWSGNAAHLSRCCPRSLRLLPDFAPLVRGRT